MKRTTRLWRKQTPLLLFLEREKTKRQNERPIGTKLERHSFRSNWLRGESFLCHVFSVESVQNLRTFWRTTQNRLILALLCSLYSKQTFKVHLGVEKHIER